MKSKRLLAMGLILGLAGVMYGCGDDDKGPQTSTVSKGPVSGAKARYFSNGVFANISARSEQGTGKIPYNGLEVRTSGGRYLDKTGNERDAPDLAALSGSTNVTPLTTIYKAAKDNNDTATVAALDKLVRDAGLSIDATVGAGQTIPASLVGLMKLNETVGEVLTQIKEQAPSANTAAVALAFAQSIAANLSSLPTASTSGSALVTAITSNTAGATLQTAIDNTGATNIDPDKIAAVADATEAGSEVQPGPTGATGGNSVGTGVGG